VKNCLRVFSTGDPRKIPVVTSAKAFASLFGSEKKFYHLKISL
jgi:hypothetical protein